MKNRGEIQKYISPRDGFEFLIGNKPKIYFSGNKVIHIHKNFNSNDLALVLSKSLWSKDQKQEYKRLSKKLNSHKVYPYKYDKNVSFHDYLATVKKLAFVVNNGFFKKNPIAFETLSLYVGANPKSYISKRGEVFISKSASYKTIEDILRLVTFQLSKAKKDHPTTASNS